LAVRSPPADRLEGGVKGRSYEVQWRVWRRLIPVRSSSIEDVVTVLALMLQWRGWPHKADGDAEDRSRWLDVMA
jgi:hypothetical protein